MKMFYKSNCTAMKNLTTLLPLCFWLVSTSCSQEVPDSQSMELCENKCENMNIAKMYNNEIGRVRQLVIGSNPDGESYDFLCDNLNIEDAPYFMFVILTTDNDVLVLSESLPTVLRRDNIQVNFSGNRFDCCDLLTQPNIRTTFGCKFKITSIEPIADK
jgi:hypothetical protein